MFCRNSYLFAASNNDRKAMWLTVTAMAAVSKDMKSEFHLGMRRREWPITGRENMSFPGSASLDMLRCIQRCTIVDGQRWGLFCKSQFHICQSMSKALRGMTCSDELGEPTD
jgi:hypothetical protein